MNYATKARLAFLVLGCVLFTSCITTGSGSDKAAGNSDNRALGMAGRVVGGMPDGESKDTAAKIVVGVGVAVAVVRFAERQASEEEKRRAKERVKSIPPTEKKEYGRKARPLVVTVDSDPAPGKRDVMVVDPETGRSVDDVVYTIEDENEGKYKVGDTIEIGDQEAIYVD